MKKSIIDYFNYVKDLERFVIDCELFDEITLYEITMAWYEKMKEEFERDYPNEICPEFKFPFRAKPLAFCFSDEL